MPEVPNTAGHPNRKMGDHTTPLSSVPKPPANGRISGGSSLADLNQTRSSFTPGSNLGQTRGDHTSSSNGEYRLQMSNPKVPDMYFKSPEHASKMADYIGNNHGHEYKIYKGDQLHSGGRSDTLSGAESKSYEQHLGDVNRFHGRSASDLPKRLGPKGTF